MTRISSRLIMCFTTQFVNLCCLGHSWLLCNIISDATPSCSAVCLPSTIHARESKRKVHINLVNRCIVDYLRYNSVQSPYASTPRQMLNLIDFFLVSSIATPPSGFTSIKIKIKIKLTIDLTALVRLLHLILLIPCLDRAERIESFASSLVMPTLTLNLIVYKRQRLVNSLAVNRPKH
jgi:hypothetical protein